MILNVFNIFYKTCYKLLFSNSTHINTLLYNCFFNKCQWYLSVTFNIQNNIFLIHEYIRENTDPRRAIFVTRLRENVTASKAIKQHRD